MTMGLFNVESVNDIAEAINEQGVTGTFTVDEMGDAVREIEVGGGGVDVDTELSISSDKQRTTGAVTLTSELTGSDYVGVSDVNLNGHLENATVKFYKMNGATPNPSVDTLLNSSITNNNGIATCNTTIDSNSSFYTVFEGLSGKYPSSQSSIVNVEYINYLFYDECNSATGLSNYAWYDVASGSTATMTYDSTENAYKLQGNYRYYGVYEITALNNLDNYKLQADVKVTSSSAFNQVGFLIHSQNGGDMSTYRLRGDSKLETWNRVNDAEYENTILNRSMVNTWITLKLTKQGTNFNLKAYDGTTELVSYNWTIPNYSNPRIGILKHTEKSSQIGYVKNIIAESI